MQDLARAHCTSATVRVYDVLGNSVGSLVNTIQQAGPHAVTIDASSLSNGVYYYTLRAGEFSASKTMIVLK